MFFCGTVWGASVWRRSIRARSTTCVVLREVVVVLPGVRIIACLIVPATEPFRDNESTIGFLRLVVVSVNDTRQVVDDSSGGVQV